MPRSATDATRFTSTTPHASKPHTALKPPANSTPAQRKTAGPVGETSQQKVKRLRAAADRARDAQVSSFDRLIVRGRVWADRAHRITAWSLIGATVVAGVVTVYALGDMMVHNRKKRAEFFAEQKAVHQSAVHRARQLIRDGTASEEDIDFISREKEHDQWLAEKARAKAQKKGIFRTGKEWLFSGLKKEEEGDDFGSSERRLGYEGLSEEDDGMGERESDVVRAIEDKRFAFAEKTKKAFEDERERQRHGGPLDRVGTESDARSKEETPKPGGWTSFMSRR